MSKQKIYTMSFAVKDIEEPIMQEVRYLDKQVDKIAKGKAMEKILRK